MNKGADYEVILGWNNLRNTAKANMHKEDFRINPIVYATKIQIKMSYPFVFKLFKAVATYFLCTFVLLNINT